MCEIKYTKRTALQSPDLSWPHLLILKYVQLARENMFNAFKTLHVWTTVEFCQSDCTVHFCKDVLTCQPKRDGLGCKTFNTFKLARVFAACNSYKSHVTNANWDCATCWHAAFAYDRCCNIVLRIQIVRGLPVLIIAD